MTTRFKGKGERIQKAWRPRNPNRINGLSNRCCRNFHVPCMCILRSRSKRFHEGSYYEHGRCNCGCGIESVAKEVRRHQ